MPPTRSGYKSLHECSNENIVNSVCHQPLRFRKGAVLPCGGVAGIWVPSIAPMQSLKYGKYFRVRAISLGVLQFGSVM